ncbi:bacillithiol biosynthesis cysteine-adding enzyme BshC [Halalkalibacterium halodurans]|uniref:Putative cysteine ligase BshC n=1 Tax=Halalkalibacterium halodurans (strain ATCC BAA-125 / DSM 18197 / FERM 7344 / JCM 9153 / C-125) TaxID=272558 RepID=BSHC_HALH5|nr:bacillithiol biosynthesis cysteine-adding enzyme BshC [Halalkalibacterium halodurans]Q9K9R8.1 RecName: Full=Putative cysteine ligase BshC [Halalkalibacterium halodurans C-125]MDY7223113.1 bacillithiol biosynthesis cysteine-adding enzyme BshC [Halalkalibacterium halodurans]MDY7242334.1 bacillithiol biosynthesis cysteine-adding enzyme BshC [Halalkalibacterium halodurans]MED4079721.1 bacillithiol biosynthesis cysteine-adding enzyme BshC [Halalkalibacterium halodurans]MED4086337.1 bacillithiol 
MIVEELKLLPSSKAAKDYLNNQNDMLSFFDYNIHQPTVFQQRLSDLQEQPYDRDALSKALLSYQKRFAFHDKAAQQVEKLKDPRSVVVIGGQQAGLLTGPLYTIYKAVTIVLLAREQERALGVPVVPVFWIAGEDHDLDEINAVPIEKNGRWRSHRIEEKRKRIASEAGLNKETLAKWLATVFRSLPETEHTLPLYERVKTLAGRSNTYTDFFAELLLYLFRDEGLVVFDSGDPSFRTLEKSCFHMLIQKTKNVQGAFAHQVKKLEQAGYGRPIITEETNAHLFYVEEGSRYRIDYTGENYELNGKNQTFSREELLEHLTLHPERFSNNVVTRPVMQDALFPVLAFVAGPGEISYWATLKRVFHECGMKMSPVVPRISATCVPSAVQKWFAEKQYSYEEAIAHGLEKEKEGWLEEQTPWPIDQVVEEAITQIRHSHKPIKDLAEQIGETPGKLANKNWSIIESQLRFMERRMKRHVRERFEHELSKFDEAERWLKPNGLLQERHDHVIQLLNIVGDDFIPRLISMNINKMGVHYLVKL